jgi:hypothetical protein
MLLSVYDPGNIPEKADDHHAAGEVSFRQMSRVCGF